MFCLFVDVYGNSSNNYALKANGAYKLWASDGRSIGGLKYLKVYAVEPQALF